MDPVWIIARNASRRPTLCHALDPNERDFTSCNVPVWTWSKFAMKKPILAMTCITCAKIHGVDLSQVE